MSDEDIGFQTVFEVSPEAFAKVLDAIENPPPPSQKLVEMLKRGQAILKKPA